VEEMEGRSVAGPGERVIRAAAAGEGRRWSVADADREKRQRELGTPGAVGYRADQMKYSPDGVAGRFPPEARYAVCFVPGDDCEGLVVEELSHAREEVLIQAYFFSSARIRKALARARERGVRVEAIFDKSLRGERYSGATFLDLEGIEVWIDEQPTITQNKVMVIDRSSVITGSFKVTRTAREQNVENLLVVGGDREFAKHFADSWERRRAVSVPFGR